MTCENDHGAAHLSVALLPPLCDTNGAACTSTCNRTSVRKTDPFPYKQSYTPALFHTVQAFHSYMLVQTQAKQGTA